MERLTARDERYPDEAYYPYCFRGDTCRGEGMSDKCDMCELPYKICKKLADYEDTGLTPQQIQELKERDTTKYLKIEQRGDVLRYYCPCCGAFFYQHVKGKLPVRMRRDHHCTCGQRIKHEIDD